MANTKQTQQARIRERRAVELRLSGATFEQIAEQVGYTTRTSARRAVLRAIERDHAATAADREELRQRMRARLERLVMGSWQKAAAGDAKSVQAVAGLLDRLAKLDGLDVPVQSKVTVSSELDAEIEQLIVELAGREAGANVVPLPVQQ